MADVRAAATASTSATRRTERSTWSEWLVDTLPGPPWLVGIGLTLFLLAVMLLAEVASGELGRMVRGESGSQKGSEYRFSVVFAVLGGYLPPAFVFTLRAGRRAFAGMRPALRGTAEELDALGSRIGRFERRALRRAGLVGAAVAFVAPIAVDLTPQVYLVWELNTAALGHRLLVPIIFWLIARTMYVWTQDARRLVTISRERLEVDLLDPTPLTPLTQYGLQNGLVWLGVISIFSWMALDWASRPGLPWVLGGLMVAAITFGVASLLLPLRGARGVIRQAKNEELAWCRSEIRRRRDSLGRGDAAPQGGSLDELVAYHELVQGVREWPFDAPTLTRLGLYLAIPVGSWLGGAMVERLVDRLLG